MCEPVVQSVLGSIADVLRSIKIRLADLEVDDVATLRLKLFGLCESLECGLGPQPGLSGCEPCHGVDLQSHCNLRVTAANFQWPPDFR